ncbi:MAG: ATP-binding protein, partial [Pseudomonadota bacterium]
VDDDDVDRERVRRFLSSSPLSVEITEANCGAEALSLIKVHAFDCVVLDNHLGDACGADLIAQLHLEARKDCPIIMLTGAGDEALAVKAIQEGASDYLAKTQLNPEGLVRSVRRSVENHRLRVELATMHQQLEQRVDDQAATIRQRERDLRALIDNSPTVMGYWDREQRCRFGNLTHGDWFFTDAKQLPGRHLREVLGQKLHDAIHLRIDATLAGQTQQFEECIEKRAMTPMRHAQIQFRPDITDDGQVQGFYATMADVTPIKAAQAKAEEFLRFSDAVIENSPIGIAVFTPAGTCMIANAAFIDTCGEPLHVLRGSDFRQRATWQACGLVDEAQRTLSDGSTHRLDVALRKPSGEEVQLACSLASVDRGGQAHLLLIARDITEQRQVLAALVAARDVANSAARAKGAFLANMSHEIRTPMNAIIGLSRLALEDTQPQVARDYVDKVHTSALALMGILDDVLDYSKIEAGYLHFERIRIDLGDLLQRVVDLFQARLEQKRLSLSVELSPRLPKYITADPLRLSQILSNLIGNAIKFTESGHIHVKVEVLDGDAAPAGDLIRFSVSDTGIGIASDLQCLLFDAFVQGDSSITRRFGGTGLGLAICKRLVELMGGHIGVESQPGQGSKFWFTAKLDLGLCLDEPTEDQQVTSPRASSTDKALARSQTLQDMAAPLRG